jgi:hypothetical protein
MQHRLKSIGVAFCVLLMAASPDGSAAIQAPSSAAPAIELLGDMWLEGVVGQATVRAYIGDAGYPKTEGLWGMYYYTKYWTGIPLEGDWIAAGRIRLFEGDPGNSGPKPRFDLRVSGSGPVTGTTRIGRLRWPTRPAGGSTLMKASSTCCPPIHET